MTIFQVEIFWVVTLYIVVVGYHRFGGPSCLHLQGILPLSPQAVYFNTLFNIAPHLCLYFINVLFNSDFLTKILYAFHISLLRATCPAHFILPYSTLLLYNL